MKEKMSNFEARIQRQKQAIEQERMKKEAEKQAALKEAEGRDAQRPDTIKNDERYKEMERIAYSQELKEALKTYRIVFGDIWGNDEKNFDISNKEQFIIEFSDREGPVGEFEILVRFSEREEPDSYSSFSGRSATYAIVTISWMNELTKQKLKKLRRKFYGGADARESVSIEFYDTRRARGGHSESSPVFCELEVFLNYLANLVVKRMDDKSFREKDIYSVDALNGL